MQISQTFLFTISFCLICASRAFIIERIKGVVKHGKCKLHSVGNSIFAHEHNHGDPCEQGVVLNNYNGNNFGSSNGQNSLNINSDIPHEQHEHYNGHSYGGDSIFSSNNPPDFQNNKDSELNGNTNKFTNLTSSLEKNNANKNSHFADVNGDPVDNLKYAPQSQPEGRLTGKDQENGQHLENQDLNPITLPEHKIISSPKKATHQNHNSDYSSEDESDEESKEEVHTTTPKIDIRAGLESNTTYAPLPKGGGKNLINAKCNSGVQTKGDNTCREEI